jgi:aspartate/methionine/tyrosine aminotransferase
MKWLKPLGGSVSVVKINEPSAEVFCHKMASDFGVVLLPMKYMGYEDQYFRMGFGRQNFRNNLNVFNQALESIYR